MKQQHKVIAAVWPLCWACLALTGCATGMVSQSLIRSCDEADPPVEKYHAAYVYKGDVVLEYTVKESHDTTFRRMSDRYWAILHLDELSNRSFKGDYSIYRRPLPDGQRDNMARIPIVNLCDHIDPALGGHPKVVAISAFIKQQPSETLPQVYVDTNSMRHLHVRYRDPNDGIIRTYRSDPYEVFIPSARYPKLILLYPFALVGDVVTFPLVFLGPGAAM